MDVSIGDRVKFTAWVRPFKTLEGTVKKKLPDLDRRKKFKYEIERADGRIVTRFHPQENPDGTVFKDKEGNPVVMIEDISEVINDNF